MGSRCARVSGRGRDLVAHLPDQPAVPRTLRNPGSCREWTWPVWSTVSAYSPTQRPWLVAAGTITVPIARTYPLSETAAAHRDSQAGHVRGKLILVPR